MPTERTCWCLPPSDRLPLLSLITIIAAWEQSNKLTGVSTVGLRVKHDARGVNPGNWGSRSLTFWAWASWGSQGVVDGSRNMIISYHVQAECSKVVTLKIKRIIWPEVAVNIHICLENGNLLVKLHGKIEIFGNFLAKLDLFFKLPEKIWFLSEICL